MLCGVLNTRCSSLSTNLPKNPLSHTQIRFLLEQIAPLHLLAHTGAPARLEHANNGLSPDLSVWTSSPSSSPSGICVRHACCSPLRPSGLLDSNMFTGCFHSAGNRLIWFKTVGSTTRVCPGFKLDSRVPTTLQRLTNMTRNLPECTTCAAPARRSGGDALLGPRL